ncbi:TPA: hypothetical protein LLC67_001869 [Enterococcus faecium]|uniref:Uncharacterized protein n=1 Tax=Enterococcus faecium TaxID=1352 RepID=A0A3G1TV68_ENTFC|nr:MULTISPECIES: hypothetical protein [Enterococcus]HAQ1581817.1 hypothetical protein [Enterococcus faecium Efm-HS0661]HCD2005244.1 hypothetical protein [Enterococcus faecalis]AYF52788.1 hypothetical protein [Enterococcus faecium]EKQ3345639.1 hypothetical protein [Enterococcus faecium]EKQ3703496.1 hypothetical protein [Enterococcus faecium]
MAKFKDITESINYVAETVPVVVLSLKPQLLEVYQKEEKEAKAKKAKAKVWKEFDALLTKDLPKKNYVVIEDVQKLSSEEFPDEEDAILDSEKYVVLLKSSLNYVVDLPEKFKEKLLAGVRFMDSNGQLLVIPDDPNMFEREVEEATDFYSAVDQLEVATKGLERIAETFNSSDAVEFEAVAEAETEAVPDEEEALFEDNDEATEAGNQEASIEETQTETYQQPKIDEKPESQSDKENYVYEAEKIVSESDVPKNLDADLLEKDFEQIIANKFQPVVLDEVSDPVDLNEEMRSIAELKPLLFLAKESMNARISIANNKINSELNKTKEQLLLKGKQMLADELLRIEEATSLSGQNQFTNTLSVAKESYEAEASKIDDLVMEKSSIIRKDYDMAKQAYLEAELKKLEQRYDAEHLPEVKQQEDEFRKATEESLDQQYQEAIESIKNDALKQNQEAKEVVVERIINSLKPEIEKSLTEVQEKTLEIVEKTKAENEAEFHDTKEKTTDVVVKYFANKEEVEKLVAKDTNELESKLVAQQNIIEDYKNRVKEFKDLADGYKLNSQKLTEQSEALREDLSRARNDLSQMAEKTKSLVVTTENQTESKRDFTSKKMATIIAVSAMACGTILGSSYFISHNHQEAQAQTETSISRVENSLGANTASTSTTDNNYEATPTTEFKVGEDVVISIDGKTTKAEVLSIDGDKAVVKAPDGNQYKIQAHLTEKN